jgi:hypothetical protein
MKIITSVLLIALLSFSCNNTSKGRKSISELPKGELAFLLNYNGKLPNDVGFLSNHIITRRLANMWKEKTVDILKLEPLGDTIRVTGNLITARFSYASNISFQIQIDAGKDAIVSGYKDSTTCEVRWESESFKGLNEFCK